MGGTIKKDENMTVIINTACGLHTIFVRHPGGDLLILFSLETYNLYSIAI